MFHPQPWILTRRTLEDANSSSEDKATDTSTVSSHQSRSQENEGYLVYSTGASDEERNANGDSSEGPRFRSQENPSQDSQDGYQENYEIEERQRNRYRDEPIDRMDVEDDDDYEYEFRNQHQQQPHQGYSDPDHSPYPYEGSRGDDQGYDEEGSYDETNNENSYDNGLQLETNAEPYDDEVAAKEENNNNNNPDDTYSLEYPQSDTDSSSSSSSNSKTNTNSESSTKDGSEKKSSEKQAKGDDGSSEEADYNDDYAYDDDDYDDYQDDTGYAKHRKKKRRRGGNDEDKKVKAPFWAPKDHLLGSHHGGQSWAVQGPPVYFEEGKPQWPPEPHGGGKGRGRKGGKGGKGKGKKGKKGKKGGRGTQKKGWHQGWGGWEKIGNGGWGEWPKGWMSGNFLDTGGQRWVDGKGWTGETGVCKNLCFFIHSCVEWKIIFRM